MFEREQLRLFITLLWHTITIHDLTVVYESDVMTPEDKILNVLKLLEVARQLSASNKRCYLDPNANELKTLTQVELKSILEKLESDNIIEILKTPYDVWPDLGKENEPEVYTIKLLNGFNEYYDKLYEASRFGIKHLTHNNYYRVFAVAEMINQELNMRTDNIATFEADKSTTTLWKGIPEKSLSLYHIKQIYLKALGFLKEIDAIKSYELYKPSSNSTTQLFKVSVNRRKFDFAYLELILNSPKSKSSALAKRLVIDKQSKPQPNYPDDTATKPDKHEKHQIEPTEIEIPQDKVRFDAKASKLTYNGKSCNIPDETLEYYICKLVFKNRRVAAKEDDILEYTTKSQESQRAVYDAMLRINKKANKQLGTPKLLSYKAAKVRITAIYQ